MIAFDEIAKQRFTAKFKNGWRHILNFGGGTHMKFSISPFVDRLNRVAKDLEAVRREIGE